MRSVGRRVTGASRRQRQEQLFQALDNLRQEYFDRALEEDYPTIASAISQYVGDQELYLEVGQDRQRLPEDWIETHICPNCEEVYQTFKSVADAAKTMTL